MKRTRLTYIVCFLVAIIVFSACSLFGPTGSVESAIIYLNKANHYIWWQATTNADYYDIYLNDSKITKVDSDKTTITFDYLEYCETQGMNYTFKVKSVSKTLGESDYSNSVSVLLSSQIVNKDDEYSVAQLQTDNDKSTTNVTISNGIMSWKAVNDAQAYVIVVYRNGGTFNYYYTQGTAVELTNIPNENSEVMAIKVASVYANDDSLYVSTDGVKYYNPVSKGDYTSSSAIYLFDGEMHDKYITSDAELRNYAYYNFVNRNDAYTMLLSRNYYREIVQSNESVINYLKDQIMNKSYLETYNYSESAPVIKAFGNDYEYSVRWTIVTRECTLNDVDTTTGMGTGISEDLGLTELESTIPYYNTVNYVKRADDYDNFASDNRYLSVEVRSSEQLFWAVEGGFTPIPKANSRAYYIYQKAKEVLREIISDQMSDYEKALSIHDWLCYNHVYDYSSLTSKNINRNMKLTCYYLESVFLDTNNLVVCDGYAKAFSLLCNMEGIDCIRVTGKLNTEGHAWNKAKIDGTWYVVDITNTELSANYTSKVLHGQTLNVPTYEGLAHQYFLVSEDDLTNYTLFEYRSRNVDYECETDYHYYDNANNPTKLFIRNDAEFEALLDYIYVHGMGSVDFALKYDYYRYLVSQSTQYREYQDDNGNTVRQYYYNIEVFIANYCNDKAFIDVSMIRRLMASYYSVTSRVADPGVLMIYMDTHFDIDSFTPEELAAYNQFVQNHNN